MLNINEILVKEEIIKKAEIIALETYLAELPEISYDEIIKKLQNNDTNNIIICNDYESFEGESVAERIESLKFNIINILLNLTIKFIKL